MNACVRAPRTSTVMSRLLGFCPRVRYQKSDVIIIAVCMTRFFSAARSSESHSVNLLGTKMTYRASQTVDNVIYSRETRALKDNKETNAKFWNETQNNHQEQSLRKYPQYSSTSNTSEGIMKTVDKYCRPLQKITLLRHGIRYASSKDMVRAFSLLDRLVRCSGNREMILHLQLALTNLEAGKEKQMSETGMAEQRDIGRRIRSRLLRSDQDAVEPRGEGTHGVKGHTRGEGTHADDFLFLSSHVERAVDSCRAFQTGLFASDKLHADISIRDDLLRFFEFCPRYLIDVKHNKSSLMEYNTWRELILETVTKQIGEHLKVVTPFNMSVDEMMSMFTIAATEFAVNGTRHWLDIISNENLHLLEYAADIKNYWLLGYGYDINYQQSCPLVVDMFSHLDRAARRHNKSKRGVFYFGHAETLIPVMSRLGLFHDHRHLRADNYEAQANRLFCTSRISPFSTNVGFTLYECDVDGLHRDATREGSSGGVPSDLREIFSFEPKRHMLMMDFKERPIKFPFVGEYLVAYDIVRHHYSSVIDGCRFDEICSTDNNR